MSLDVGSRIGDYEIVSTLGAGGMGKVFKVRNVISDRIEAMKVLLPDLEQQPELADRFMREIKVQASLQHPNIAALHTALRVDNQLLMLMELVDGITLDQRLQQGPVPLRDAVDYIGQVLGALGYAHQHGVIHRDIKPANMMLTPKGTMKLMDFGIAKGAADRKLTMTGTTMGSLYYMSPEQIKGMANLDARSDLYSVGVSLYELVTGKKPFDGDSQFAIMAAHLEKVPVPPITLDTNLPALLNDVILMSIAKDPEQRFQSAQAFGAALGSVRESLGMAPLGAAAPSVGAASSSAVTAPLTMAPAAAAAPPPIVPAPQVVRPKSSKRWLWVSAGALATVLVLVAAIQFGPWKKTSANTAPQPESSVSGAPPAASTTAPPPVTAPPPEQQTTTPPPVEPVPAQTAAQPGTQTATPSRSAAKKGPVRQSARQVSTPAQTSVSSPASQQATPVKQVPPSAAEAAPDQAVPAKSVRTGPDPAVVLQEVREQLVDLSARAGAVRNSLSNLKRSQAANGMSLRGDMAAAESRMNSLMEGANAALNAHDAASAKKFTDSADREVEKLEKFLWL
jgi:serine/threonine-protein kinase